jgi:erythromycin esterase
VGDARVVAFGEAIHGGHEFLVLRNRLFAYLVEHAGVTAIAVETGFADSTAIDDYVSGKGEDAPSLALVSSVFSFARPRALAENRELIAWMRAYNRGRGARRKLRFYGLDMVGEASIRGRAEVSRAFRMAVAYVRAVAPGEAADFEQRLGPIYARLEATPYEALSPGEKEHLTVGLADLVSLFERRDVEWIAATSPLAYQRAYRNAVGARALDADCRVGGWWSNRADVDINQRDAAQAQQLRWALEQEGKHGRIFLFAYNGHIRTAPYTVSDPKFTSMGEHLRASLGADLFAIGSAFGAKRGFPGVSSQASAPDSVNGLLEAVGPSTFFLDLRQLPATGPASDWWRRPRPLQSPEFINQLSASTAFDALIFTEAATPTHTLG